MTYQAHIASNYYRIAFDESTVAPGPARAHLDVATAGGGRKSWSLPVRRFKHGAVFMDLFAFGLPEDMSDRIVRANTM